MGFFRTVLALTLMGCGTTASDPSPAEGSWAGSIEGTDGYIAIVTDHDKLVAYACDSGAIHDWFFGSATASLAASSNGISLSASPSGDGWRGQITLSDGSSHAFAADRAPGVLFRADGDNPDARWVGGWIDRASTGQRGALFVERGGATTQSAPILATSTFSVSTNGGVAGLTVRPVDPSAIPTQVIRPASTRWTASGRVSTATATPAAGVGVRFLGPAGGLLGSARTGTDGTYRLAMTVPAQPVAVSSEVVRSDGSPAAQASAASVQSVPGGASTVNIRLR